MKSSRIFSNRAKTHPARHATKGCLAAVLGVFIGLSWGTAIGRAQQPDDDVPGEQVLTRGPVHEAFAGIVTFNPEAGVVVTKAPPDVIEEMPPEERPEGDNVTWIPGYWAWDDERTDFLWVSGTWRALPPGREWMAGYWGKTPQGHQWTSGYWADTTERETTYLPPPPATVEVGPNIAAPSIDYGWTPGCWMWYQGRYAWRPGYWAEGRADWDWTPAHYVWSPRGYIFVGGFWDYPVARRGILFAPVYFESGVYARRGYSYSPRIVIDLGVFTDHLFLRPRYQHYYFGDYYAPSYHQGGFYASFSFQSSRHGYDPFYSHQRWEHRRDRDWHQRVEASYHHRRDHENARPPRTWAAQRNINPATVESRQNRVVVATTINVMVKTKDSPIRFQPVAREERQRLSRRGQEVQQSREQRRTLEARAVDTTARKPGGAFEPAKVQLPRSPIVAKPAGQLAKNQAPPQAQRAPKPDPKFRPKAESSGRQPDVDRSNPQRESRKTEPEKKVPPGRNDAAPRERQFQPEKERRKEDAEKRTQGESPADAAGLETKAQPVPEQRAKDAAVKNAEDSQRNARGLEKKAQQESAQAAQAPAVKAREASPRNASTLARKEQQESEKRAKDAAVKTAEDSQRNARGLEKKAQQESAQAAQAPAVKARQESQRNASGLERKAQRVSQQPARQRPAPAEKGAAQLIRKDRKKQGKDPQTP